MGGDDEFPLASLFTKRDISLLGVSNLFFSIAFEKSAFFWRSRLRLQSESAQELQDKRGVFVVKWREAVVMGAVFLA